MVLSSIFYVDPLFMVVNVFIQVLGLLVEIMKKGFRKHIGSVLPVARSILQSTINGVTERSLGFSDEVTVPFWKEAYYSLIMLEKMLHQFRDICFQTDLEVCNKLIVLVTKHKIVFSVCDYMIDLYKYFLLD